MSSDLAMRIWATTSVVLIVSVFCEPERYTRLWYVMRYIHLGIVFAWLASIINIIWTVQP